MSKLARAPALAPKWRPMSSARRHLASLGLLLLLFPARAPAAAAGGEPQRFEPPAGFVRLDDGLFAGSAALLPVLAAGARPELLAVFVEPGREEGAALALGRVEGPFDLERAPGVQLASAIAGHLRAELDLEATVERATAVAGPRAPRWEARALTRAGQGPRIVRFAFFPGPDAYHVLAAAYAPDQEEALAARLQASFDSFEPPVVARTGSRGWTLLLAALGAAGIAGVAVGLLWRRRG